jgi:3-phenylpropionate/cinnamic acid dioxygenase small subunit
MTDAERLQLLEDREEIRQIFVDYARYLDSGNHAGYASLFASDGVLSAHLGESLGPHATGHLPEAIHVMSNHDIDIEGDEATAVVVWYYLTSDVHTEATILQGGRYRDDLVRENGRWKIKRHQISRAMGRSPMSDPPPNRLDALEARIEALENR